MQTFSRRTALALAAGLVVAACGSDSDSSSDETTAPSTPGSEPGGTTAPVDTGATASSATESSTATSEGETAGSSDLPAEGDYDTTATLRYAYSVGPSRFDPHLATSSFDNTSLYLTYDRLVHQAPDSAAVPGLATEWEFAEDGSSLTFTIREGVTFHDGEALTAEAVKANIERAKTIEGSAVASELAVIDTVEVVDGKVQLNLNAPGAQLPLVLSDRAGMLISPAAFENADLDQAPVGAGMFRVTEYREGDTIIYERFEDYWAPEEVRVAKLEFTIAGDAVARLNAITTGQIDMTFVDPQQESEAESAGLTIERSSGLAYYHMQMNRSFEPFGVLEVRQAINHAINREEIIEGLLFGLGDASTQVFPEGYFAYDEETGTETYPYDTAKATELLAAGGYADGFEFEMIVPTIPLILQLGEIVQAQLGEIGITATIRQVEPAQTADIFYAKQEGNGLVSPWGGRPDPSQTLNLLFSAEGFSNPGRITTEAMGPLIDATEAVQSAEERQAALKAASAQVTADALDCPIYFPVTPTVFTENVIGVRQWLSGKPEFRGVGIKAG